MGTNERLVELEESGWVSMLAKPTIEKAGESPGSNTQVGDMGGPRQVRADLQNQVLHR